MTMSDRSKIDPEVFDIVERDLDAGLEGVFSPVDGFVRLDTTLPADDGPTAIVWRYHAVHDGDFLGLAPTGQELLIEGVTIATPGPDGWQLARYIDWLSVAGQLGLTLSGRPVVDSRPG
jgi:hypothetical protein